MQVLEAILRDTFAQYLKTYEEIYAEFATSEIPGKAVELMGMDAGMDGGGGVGTSNSLVAQIVRSHNMLYGDFYRWAKSYALFPKPCTKQTLVDFWNEFADARNADTGVPEMSYSGFHRCLSKLGSVLSETGFFGQASVAHPFLFEHLDESAIVTLCTDRRLLDDDPDGTSTSKADLTENFVKVRTIKNHPFLLLSFSVGPVCPETD